MRVAGARKDLVTVPAERAARSWCDASRVQRRVGFGTVVGLAGSAAATGLALLLAPRSAVIAAMLELLAVVVVSASFGAVAGIVTALAGFVELNFFFIEPLHGLTVRHTSDLIALAVFVAVAVIVGALVAKLSRERARAERGERAQAQLRVNAEQLALERAASEEDARRAREQAEIERIRGALFSSVSHDLRTPLASIKAGVTSLLDPGSILDAGVRADLLGTMLEETDRLNRLVGNILGLAKARAGGLSMETELVPFEDVIEAVLARIRPRAGHVTLVAKLREELPAIWVDALKVDQALTNVLENALRYAPTRSEITVAVASWHGGVQVRIADRGPGIPVDAREDVFEPFKRGSDRSEGGSGLGLAIARAVVLAHAGRIWVEETPGGGATFVIELPAGRAPEDP